MRKDIFERMRFFVKEDIKPNFSQIARQYGVDRRTAKTLYDKAGQVKEVVRKKRNIHGKLDDFKEIVKLKYEAGCTAMAIYRFIQKKGYTGGYTLVKTFCRNYKQEEIKKATIRVTHTIGLSAQVDWKGEVKLRDKYRGVEIRSHNLTDKQFNYNEDDYKAILKTDLFKDRSEDELNKYMSENLKAYDCL